MGVGEMRTQFVGVPVGYLGALFCVAPGPIGCFVSFGGCRRSTFIEESERIGDIGTVVENDCQRMKSTIWKETDWVSVD